jgi:hypothetical protein
MRPLPFLLLLLAFVPSCRGRSSSDHYWARACTTKDEKLLLAAGDEAAAVDLETGKVLARTLFYGEYVFCRTSDGAAYDTPEQEMVKLPSGVRGPSDKIGVRDIAIQRADGTYVRSTRPKDSKGRFTGAGTVRGETGPPVLLGPSLFGAVGAAKQLPSTSGFITGIRGEMPDGRIAMLVGWTPNRMGTVEPIPWGLFALDVVAGRAQLLGVTRPNDERRGIWNLDDSAVTNDASAFAATFYYDKTLELAIFDPKIAAPRSVVALDDARESTVLSYSEKGDRLLVATLTPPGTHSYVRIVDAQTGKIAWSTPRLEGTVYHAKILADGSVVYMTSVRRAARLNADGTKRWESGP